MIISTLRQSEQTFDSSWAGPSIITRTLGSVRYNAPALCHFFPTPFCGSDAEATGLTFSKSTFLVTFTFTSTWGVSVMKRPAPSKLSGLFHHPYHLQRRDSRPSGMLP